MQTLEHNQITYNQLKPYIDSHQDCCVVNPCGSGKSSIIEAIVSDYSNSNILIVTKQANASNYYHTKSNVFKQSSVPILTYNALYNCFKNDEMDRFQNIDICIFDEAHYIGAPKWSMAVDMLREISDCIFVGVTATPQRFIDQGTNKSIVDKFGKNSVGNYTVKQLQKQGVFIEPEYIVSLATMDQEIDKRLAQIENLDLSNEKKEWYIERLESTRKIWEEKGHPEIVIRDILPDYLYKPHGNKILIFSKNVDSIQSDKKFIMNILERQFPGKKIKTYEYSYKTSEHEFAQFLSDETNYINVLFSVNKVCETIHISDLNILVFLRSSVSNRIITQQIGRINDINNKNKSLIIDMVDNLSRYGSANHNCVPCVKNTRDENTSLTVRYNLMYVNEFIHIFDEIDKVASGVKQYQYKDFRGTLRQVCYVFRRDFYAVRNLIDEGYTLEQAMRVVPSRKKNCYGQYKPVLPKNILEQENFDFVLSEKEKELIAKYNNMVYEIAKSKNCYDEDIIAHCQLHLCKVAHDYVTGSTKSYENAYFANKILQFLLRLLQNKQDELAFVERLEENYAYDMTESIDKKIDYENMKEQLFDLLQGVPLRACIIIMLRYGLESLASKVFITGYAGNTKTIQEYTGLDFSETKTLEEIGCYYQLTRNRIRQIEDKALRTMRRHIGGRRSVRYERLAAYREEYFE